MGKRKPEIPRNSKERVAELCKEHHPLAHHIIQKHFGIYPAEERYDDLLAEALYKLVQVAQIYNPKIAKFSTLYCSALIRHINRIIRVDRRGGLTRVGDSRKENRAYQQTVFHNSLNATQNGSTEEWGDLLTYQEREQEAKDEDLSWLEVQFNTLPKDQQGWLVDRYFRGLTLREISRERNCSRQNVQQTVEKLLNTLRRRYALQEHKSESLNNS